MVEQSPMEDQTTQLFDFDDADSSAELSDELHQALQEHFGLGGFRAGQQRVIERVLQGRSTLALMPTGAGKSLCYQLPALMLPYATVVISPLIALMKDQLDGLPPAVREQATQITSSLPFATIKDRLREVAAGRYKLIFVAPERLRQREFLHALQQIGISLVVVDEAHCVSLWGLSFRPDYLFIGSALETLGRPPVLALTATASPATEQEILHQLGPLEVVRTNVFRPNLHFEVMKTTNQSARQALAVDLCRHIEGPIIVYVRSRNGCEELAAMLKSAGVAAEAYHAGLADRDAVQDRFMRGETRVIAATIAFGMGIDKPDVRAVIHVNLSKSLEDYVQEAGRAGRDGQISRCILIYSPSDKGQLSSWMQQDCLTREELRSVYRAIMRKVGQGQDCVAIEYLSELCGLEETRLRVALGMLERAELIRRHYDLPRTARLRQGPRVAEEPSARALCDALRLNGRTQEWPIQTLAEHLDTPLSTVEARLLVWNSAGALDYEGRDREMLLEVLPPPADAGPRIERLLGDYRSVQEQRVESLGLYANNKRSCRHGLIARQFGQRLDPCQDACDICAGRAVIAAADMDQPRLRPQRPATSRWGTRPLIEHQQTIVAAVEAQSAQHTARELAMVLTGARGYGEHPLSGALSQRSFDSVRAEIDVLVEAGHLAYRGSLVVLGHRAQQPATPTGPVNEGLLLRLKEWRADRASELNVPRYIICADTVLFDIAAQRPLSLAELRSIKGIGPQKAAQWGEQILALVARFSEEEAA